ncbi:transposable element Tcb2 transposase [Trichonephila clavipes]|nr:transposable element Tcb2 transposase [Trichonephila clavipes]
MRTANCFIGRHPGTGSTFTRGGNWTAAEWNQVVFSDESRFNLSSDDNRVRVWRPRGECLNPAFVFQRYTAPTASVMVWGAIAYNTRLPLVLIRGTTTSCNHTCCHSCNGSQEPFFNKTMLGLTLQGCHKTISALLLLFLEHIWDDLGRRVGNPTNLNELEARVQQIWNEMSQDIIQSLYASMSDRIASCIRARVVSTGY